MAKSDWINGFGALTLWVLLITARTDGATIEPQNPISPDDIRKVMSQDFNGMNSRDAFVSTRYLVPANNLGRENMQDFLRQKFASILGLAGGKEAGHVLHHPSFTTSIKTLGSAKQTQVTGINYYAVLAQKENNTEEDSPLVILANYDTDTSLHAQNPVEENGSGIAALLVIGEKLAADIHSEKVKLKHTVILAAVDASIEKHATDGIPVNATTGADEMANKFLPEFLSGRDGIRGVIVLDGLLNFQDGERTQSVAGFDRAYPEAYKEMSSGNFAGDFLGLVARSGEVDRRLVEVFEEKWNETRDEGIRIHDEDSNPTPARYFNARLIKFIHKPEDGQGEAYLHFLKSDQTSFWTHESNAVPPYPAILLTDTRSYRDPICAGYCNVFEETTNSKNLDFSYRTLTTLYETIVKLQSGAAIHLSTTLTFLPLLLASFRYFLM